MSSNYEIAHCSYQLQPLKIINTYFNIKTNKGSSLKTLYSGLCPSVVDLILLSNPSLDVAIFWKASVYVEVQLPNEFNLQLAQECLHEKQETM